MDWLDIKDKSVIVTGGASGIGRAIVDEFVALGSKVVVADVNPDEPDFCKENNNIKYIVCDVTDRESVESMVEETIKTFGKVDVLVNNAGINIPRLLVDDKDPKGEFELGDGVFDKVWNINVKGVYLCAQACARNMVENGSGVIINMSSECGLEGSEGQSIYAATKNAVNSFTRSWAKELGKKGVRVVGVAPGIMEATGLRTLSYETALAYTRGITVEKLRAGYTSTSTTPIGREGKLSEVANLVCFLASERAGYIHGVTYNVAGGKTRG